MSADVDKVENSTVLPPAVDAVVIGAGIVGAATAYELARKGVSVALLEKGRVGGEQSSRNWGWCRQQNRDPRELPLAMFGLRRWPELAEETGEDMGFRRSGIVYATTRQSEIDTWEAWGKRASEFGFHSEILTADRAHELTPGSRTKWVGGVHSPTDGHADPSRAAPVLARATQRLGGHVLQECAVRGLDIAGGRVTGVFTERGRIATQSVVLAGGAWSSRFCRRHGIDLPQANVIGTAMRTTVAPKVITHALYTPTFCVRPAVDGSFTLSIAGRGRLELTPQAMRYARTFYAPFKSRLKNLKFRMGSSFFNGPDALGDWAFDQTSPFERIRVMDPTPDGAMMREAIAALSAEYPALAGVRIVKAWGGLIDSTPDIIPVISPAGPAGLVLSTGYSGHGFGIGPAAGRLTADLVTGDTPVVDPTPFRYDRLVNGTDLGKPGLM